MRAVDTQVLIWGVKKASSPTRAHMIQRAEDFIDECRKNKEILMIPAIALSEFLAGYDDADRPAMEQKMTASFYIAPFDALAASIAAEIWHKKPAWQKIQSDLTISRQCLKADLAIVATAIAHKAKRIIAEDAGVHAFSAGRILCDHLPSLQTKIAGFE